MAAPLCYKVRRFQNYLAFIDQFLDNYETDAYETLEKHYNQILKQAQRHLGQELYNLVISEYDDEIEIVLVLRYLVEERLEEINEQRNEQKNESKDKNYESN